MRFRRILLLATLALALGGQPAAAAPVSAESKAMGAAYIRVDVEMNAIWGSRLARPDWRGLDQVMLLSRRYRLPVLAIVLGTPAWLGPCDRARRATRPSTGAGKVAAHARGVIDGFEILNEPDESWAFRGSAQDYARMLSASYNAIRRRAPAVQVALGGIGWLASRSWLASVFATPAPPPRKFDIANVHLRDTVGALPGQVAEWRAFFRAHGFAGPLWVTEHRLPRRRPLPARPGVPGRRGRPGRLPAQLAARARRGGHGPSVRDLARHAAGFERRAGKTRRALGRPRRLLSARRRCAARRHASARRHRRSARRAAVLGRPSLERRHARLVCSETAASRGCARRARVARRRVRRLRVRWRRELAAVARYRRGARDAGLGALHYARLVAGG